MGSTEARAIVRAEGNAAAFLTEAMRVVVEKELVSNQRFVEIIPPTVLAKHLSDRPEHQAVILMDAQKIPETARDALKKMYGLLAVETVANTLELALSEDGPATPESIRGAVTYEDWVTVLSAPLLWKFITDGDWYKDAWAPSSVNPAADGKGRGRTGHPAYTGLIALLELLDKHKLITPLEKYDRITLDVLIRDLPGSIKDGALRLALMHGENENKAFKAGDLFGQLAPVSELTHCIESLYLWQKLVLFVADREGWLTEPPADNGAISQRAASGATMTPPDPVLEPAPDRMPATDAEAKPDSEVFNASDAESMIPNQPKDAEAQADGSVPAKPESASAVVDENDITAPPDPDAADEPSKLNSQPPPKPKKGDSDPPNADG